MTKGNVDRMQNLERCVERFMEQGLQFGASNKRTEVARASSCDYFSTNEKLLFKIITVRFLKLNARASNENPHVCLAR